MNDGFDLFYGYAQKRDEYSDIVVGGHSSTEAENPRHTTYSTLRPYQDRIYDLGMCARARGRSTVLSVER